MFKKKPVDKICGNCRLHDSSRGMCRVVVLWEGQRVNVPVDPKKPCFFEGMPGYPSFTEDIQEVKFWVENDQGEKIDGINENGVVKMEYPAGFFGED